MTWEKDWSARFRLDRILYASMSMVMVLTAMHLECTYLLGSVKCRRMVAVVMLYLVPCPRCLRPGAR
jgi:hypothetical protein